MPSAIRFQRHSSFMLVIQVENDCALVLSKLRNWVIVKTANTSIVQDKVICENGM
jgi:hypothetical protein